jgi:hypothetical protein
MVLASTHAICIACVILLISLLPMAARGNPPGENSDVALENRQKVGSVAQTINGAAPSPSEAVAAPKTEQALLPVRPAGEANGRLAVAGPMVGDVKQKTPPTKETPVGIITSSREKFFNISRLQARVTPDGRWSFFQGTFVRFPGEFFIAESLEFTKKFQGDPDILYSEINIGGPLVFYPENPKLFGWVTRIQISNLMTPQYSLGLQYNISNHAFLDNLRKRLKLTMFVQAFPVKSKHTLGDVDILHYFSISVYKSLYVRGTNRFFFYYGKEKNYVQSFQDLILPLHSTVDLFVRHSYQNRNDLQFGQKGSEFSMGVRFNIMF